MAVCCSGHICRRQNKTEAPALVVSTASLWHMLHVTDARVFAEDLGSLGKAAKTYLGSVSGVGALRRGWPGSGLRPCIEPHSSAPL